MSVAARSELYVNSPFQCGMLPGHPIEASVQGTELLGNPSGTTSSFSLLSSLFL